MTTSLAYFDAQAGCAGDMFLGALVDVGWGLSGLRTVVRALGLDDVEVEAEAVRRRALVATKVHVLVRGAPAEAAEHERPHDHAHAPEHSHGHRTVADMIERVRRAEGLPSAALADAVRTFRHLAEAEGRVHGAKPEEVRFHEVGAADALVDVVGTCVGLRHLGVDEVRVGPLPWFTGTVETAHGLLPLPAPAVAHLMEGHPVFASGERREQVTPTGAALVRALGGGTQIPAGFVPRRVGLGAGTQPGDRLPNVLRLVLGDRNEEDTPADAVVLETNLDDATGQETARAMAQALAAGALDAWATPVTMKKGRTGVLLSVLAAPGDVAQLEVTLFREVPTLGVRRYPVRRTVLARRHEPVSTPWGDVRMKVRETPDGPRATPEHDDALLLSERHGIALTRVLDAARQAYGRQDHSA